MRILFTLLFIYCFSPLLPAQQMTGIWRGYFSSSVSMLGDASRNESYKFEVQLLQEKNNLRGVSYSYKTTVFFGKAEMTGIYTPGLKRLILKENKLTDLKISSQSEACLMTCYLDYSSIGKMEFLEGTFYAVNIHDKTDCGSGKIHLEKVKESDFKKEDFLLGKSTIKNPPLKANTPATGVVATPKPGTTNRPSTTITSPPVAKVNPAAPATVQQPVELPKAKISGENPVSREPANADDKIKLPEQPVKKEPIPRVLLERENALVKTIITDQKEIRIDLYDNGTIDNDTITVYHNNRLVTASQRLNFTPISFTIKSEPGVTTHEIVVVADNLGDIPPNTALMVVTTGGKNRVEIFLASNEQKNAKVIIEYRPKNK
ncbi:MAG: hypothetical protein ACK55T_09950 [Bacteroidota bacterium]